MWLNGACETKETAIVAVRKYLEDWAYNRYTSNNARYALEELDKFGSEAFVTDTTDNRYWGYEIDWGDAKVLNHGGFTGDTKDQGWKPTEQEIRDCCGIWVDPVGIKTRVIPFFEWGQGKRLLDFECADEFHSFMDDKGLARLEPIPEQCIPKAEPKKESYQVKFPLLAGILE